MSRLKFILILFLGVIVGVGGTCLTGYRLGYFKESGNDVSINAESSKIKHINELTDKEKAAEVPILMYHHVKTNTDPNNMIEKGLDVPVEMFQKQMGLLDRLGFQTITMEKLTDQLSNEHISGSNIALTFDDGYDDVYTNALPVMKKYNMVGTIYLITDNIDKPGYLTKSQIKELITEGFEVGSHSLNHPNLAEENTVIAKQQIETSKEILENIFDIKINSFCYPSGRYNNRVLKLVQEANYTNAVSTVEGFARAKSNLFSLPRMRVSGTDKLADFAYNIFSI